MRTFTQGIKTAALMACLFCTTLSQGQSTRNLLLELGYSQSTIDQRIDAVYKQLFEGKDKVYFEVGDSMAYVSDVKNKDVRSEGLSYGLMVAVQLDKQAVFDKIWRWTQTYVRHHDGSRKGYFAWSFNPTTMRRNAQGAASDGELYIVTCLLYAGNRWGNEGGIDYYGEARQILDASWEKDGTDGVYPLFNIEHKQITFVPDRGGYNWTDPSYHVPAFLDYWADHAKDGHEAFYRACADTSRAFLKRACHPVTGLNADYTEFSGEPRSTNWMPAAFRYDSWRVPMNITMDYLWTGKDKAWQQDYARRIQGFFRQEGIDSFVDQYNLDGTKPEWILQAGGFRVLRHSIGLQATLAATSLMLPADEGADFVHALMKAKLEPYEDGYFDPYFDGLLYLFSLLHLSGQFAPILP